MSDYKKYFFGAIRSKYPDRSAEIISQVEAHPYKANTDPGIGF
ncbi:MAG TPA: hypothetical protein VGK39_06070 [Cyclobacteriaceae bacterium]